MANVPKKVVARLQQSIPAYKNILLSAQGRDVNESDTVTIVTDMLSDVFGIDKYSELTREFGIQGSYCDLAIKIEGTVHYLVEVKAIGLTLKDKHTRQAVTYAAKQGVKWVVLTNGVKWIIYRVIVDGKVEAEEVCSFNFLELKPKSTVDQEALFMLCRRGLDKDLIEQFYEYRQSVNKYMISAVLSSDSVLSSIKKELKKIKDGLKVDNEEINEIIWNQIIKREVTENEATIEAIKIVNKAKKKAARKTSKKQDEKNSVVEEVSSVSEEEAELVT